MTRGALCPCESVVRAALYGSSTRRLHPGSHRRCMSMRRVVVDVSRPAPSVHRFLVPRKVKRAGGRRGASTANNGSLHAEKYIESRAVSRVATGFNSLISFGNATGSVFAAERRYVTPT